MDTHHLFVCKEESKFCRPIKPTGPPILQASVPGFVSKRKRASRAMGAPGTAMGVNVKKHQKLLSDEARMNCDAAVKWAMRLHTNNQSLNGKFEASDLKMDQLHNVKCEANKMAVLKKMTPKRKRKDFKRIGKIIKTDILMIQSEDDAPHDVKLLLNLLDNYTPGSEVLIANHPGLKTESEKIALFGRLFAEMQTLSVTDPATFQKIIGLLPFDGVWTSRVGANTYVRSVYNYRPRTYQTTSEGELYLHRNCFQHLIKDYSMQTKGGVTTVLFTFNQMEHMLGTVFPGFIAALMEQLHKESMLQATFS